MLVKVEKCFFFALSFSLFFSFFLTTRKACNKEFIAFRRRGDSLRSLSYEQSPFNFIFIQYFKMYFFPQVIFPFIYLSPVTNIVHRNSIVPFEQTKNYFFSFYLLRLILEMKFIEWFPGKIHIPFGYEQRNETDSNKLWIHRKTRQPPGETIIKPKGSNKLPIDINRWKRSAVFCMSFSSF